MQSQSAAKKRSFSTSNSVLCHRGYELACNDSNVGRVQRWMSRAKLSFRWLGTLIDCIGGSPQLRSGMSRYREIRLRHTRKWLFRSGTHVPQPEFSCSTNSPWSILTRWYRRSPLSPARASHLPMHDRSHSVAAVIPTQAESRQVHIQVRLAGLTRDSELKTALACDLLVTSNITVDLQRWYRNSDLSDLLIVDLSDPRGCYAHDRALHERQRVLIFGEASGTAGTLAPHMPVAAIEKAIRGALLANALNKPLIAESSLLAICLRATAVNICFRWGPFSAVLYRRVGCIKARKHSDLQAVQAHATHGGWRTTAISESELMDGTWSISKSLDAFLIDACRHQETCLPDLADTYQLCRWPDLGELKSHPEILRFSLLLRSACWSVDNLATRCRVTRERTNAFCWAMLASGTLVKVGKSQSLEANFSENSQPLRATVTPSTFRRLVRRIGLAMW